MQVNQSSNVTNTLACYADSVSYFDEGQKDQAYIRTDLERYNIRWPIRRDGIAGEVQLREATAGEFAAAFQLDFSVESWTRREWITGTFEIDMNIVMIGGTPKITSIREKVLRREKGKLAR